jgi:hypothetical protein
MLFSLVYHVYRQQKEQLSDWVCYSFLQGEQISFNYDAVDDTIKMDKFLIFPLCLPAKECERIWLVLESTNKKASLSDRFRIMSRCSD